MDPWTLNICRGSDKKWRCLEIAMFGNDKVWCITLGISHYLTIETLSFNNRLKP